MSPAAATRIAEPDGADESEGADESDGAFMGTAVRMSSDFETLLLSMRSAAGALRDAGIRFALAGSVAVWARGGADTTHDVDFLVKEEDAGRALEVLAKTGFRTEKPPEGWLYKAYGGDGELIDLIFRPASGPVDDDLLDRAEVIEVYAIRMPVLTVTDVLMTKLLALKEHDIDLGPTIEIARALREQVDWDELRRHTEASPFAKAFFTLAQELELAPG
jgi:predicted nucleotidyltransferase